MQRVTFRFIMFWTIIQFCNFATVCVCAPGNCAYHQLFPLSCSLFMGLSAFILEIKATYNIFIVTEEHASLGSRSRD